MTGRPTQQELLEVRQFFGLPSIDLVEKDWHVVQVIRTLTSIDMAPFRLVFAGGTCLARAHRLVQRMSEDVDFKVVLQEGATPPRSKNALRQALGALRDEVTAALLAAGFQFDPQSEQHLRSRDSNHYVTYHLAHEGQGGARLQLRPTVQVELKYCQLRQPSVSLQVQSFVAEAFGRPAEIPSIACASITETAAEKLVALTRRTAMALGGVEGANDPTIVRHIYDLHVVRDRIDQGVAASLAREIAVADVAEFAGQYPAYQADIAAETRKALATWQSEPAAVILYENFVAAMVYGDQAPYGDAIETLATLVAEAWA